MKKSFVGLVTGLGVLATALIITATGGNSDNALGAYYFFTGKLPQSEPTYVVSAPAHTPLADVFGQGTYVTGAEPGQPGYGLDVMYLIKYASADTADARRYKELIELYLKAENGQLDAASVRLPASAYAGMHRNETSSATFLDGGLYESATGGYASSDMTLSMFTGDMARSIGLSGSGGAFVDRNSDGVPDGPFQIENGSGVPSSRRSTMNGHGAQADRDFDIWFFPDSLAWVNYSLSGVADSLGFTSADPRELIMAASVNHNRGSMGFQAFGIPYNATGRSPERATYVSVSATSTTTGDEARVLFRDLIDTFDRLDVPINGTDSPSQRALGVCLALKAGWFLETGNWGDLKDVFQYSAPQEYFHKIFPEAGTATPREFLMANYAKDPWEVAGMSRDDYAHIYGMSASKYSSYYPYVSLFKVETRTSSAYKNKLNGEDPPVVHVFDNVVIGHCVGSALLGESILLELVLKAGVPDTIDNAIVDPTNPKTVYRSKTVASGSYSPVGASVDTERNFNALLSMLEVQTSPNRLLGLYSVYAELGTHYVWGGGGRLISSFGYNAVLDHYSLPWRYDKKGNRIAKKKYPVPGLQWLKDNVFKTVSGKAYSPGMPDSDLLLSDRRIYDCAALASQIFSLGTTTPNGKQQAYYYNTSALEDAAPSGRGVRFVTVGDKTYDVGGQMFGNKNYSFSELRSNAMGAPGGLQPGDIIVNPGSHAWVFLCWAPSSMVIPQELTVTGKSLAVGSGDMIAFEAGGAESNSINGVKMKRSGSGRVVRPYYFDDN
jgi:hypothetical protein